jgi:hypothetical protein
VEQLPRGATLYSNAYDAVFLFTGRPTRPLPAKFDPNSLQPNEAYDRALTTLRGELEQSSGMVVYSKKEHWRAYMPTEADLEAGLAPVKSRNIADGTLFWVDGPGTIRR